MKRFNEFFKVNLPSKKLIYILSVLVVIYTLFNFIEISNNPYSELSDFIVKIFNNYFTIGYFLFAIYLLSIYNVSSKREVNKYILLRFKDKKKWYNNKLIIVGIISLIFVLFVLGICLLQGGANLSFQSGWSEYFKLTKSMQYNSEIVDYIISKITPLNLIILNVIYWILYFFTMGTIFFITSIIFKKRVLAIGTTIFVNCLSILMYRSDLVYIERLSPLYNVIILGRDLQSNIISSLYTPFLYWFFILLIIYIIGRVVINKIDFEFGENL